MELNKIYNMDCLEGMKMIEDKSVDMILCDLPYATTSIEWDVIIPFEPLWEQYERIIKENGAIVLTASQPFSSALVMSNTRLFKYEWIWDKVIPSGMGYARFQPMRQHESILVFYKEPPTYNKQMTKRKTPIKEGGKKGSLSAPIANFKDMGGKIYDEKNPTTIISYQKIRQGSVHPTQKPVSLFEYLIKTYTNEGELVLDNCMGSGTTAIASYRTGRNFIGFELNEEYYKLATKRIEDEKAQTTIFDYL